MAGLRVTAEDGKVVFSVGEDKYAISDLEAARKVGDKFYEACTEAEKQLPIETEKVGDSE